MRCLVTGGTGFLGKRVLQLLLEDSRVEEVHVVSRRKATHPHEKVIVHLADLTSPWTWFDDLGEIDTVIHLAGLYKFNQPFHSIYKNNVLSTINLIDRLSQIRPDRRPQVLFASTYAVGLGTRTSLSEKPLIHLPPTSESYAYTKALAERALSDSSLAARIFRLGVLVGDSRQGEIEKIDGPYYLMNCLDRLARSRVSRFVKKLPIPVEQNGIIPLVPVDLAAQVFHRALFLKPIQTGKKEYFGVFNSKSVPLGTLTHKIFENHFPKCEPILLSPNVPERVLKLQAHLTGIPKDIFNYILTPVPLGNPHFESTFGSELIPHFDHYTETFFRGFRGCTENSISGGN